MSKNYRARPYLNFDNDLKAELDAIEYSLLVEHDSPILARHGIKETHPSAKRRLCLVYFVSRALDSANPDKAHKYRKHEALYTPPYYYKIRKVRGPGMGTISYQVLDSLGWDGWLNRPYLTSRIGTTFGSDNIIVITIEELGFQYKDYDILPGTGRDNCQIFARELANRLIGPLAVKHIRRAPSASFTQRSSSPKENF
jgi:hypothetical protein